MPSRPRHLIWSAALVAAGLALTGCGGSATSGDDSDTLTVVAAFAPLADIAEAVGGDAVEVISLTPPGVEPHDLELSAEQVAAIADADLVISIPGFQPAVDEAVVQQAPDRSLDASSAVLRSENPHVWMSPINAATIARSVNDALSQIKPDAEPTFRAGYDAFAATMSEIDAEYRTALANCESTVIVSSHDAFEYLAKEYGFTTMSVSGISPEAEPSPARLAEITDFVKANGVTTIYTEVLLDPSVAEVIAAETGAQVAVLDPIESLTDGATIADVMRSNLDVLIEGQRCR